MSALVFRPTPHDVTGKVTRKLEADGEARIEGDLHAVNQKGETLISGSFVAALPRRP